MGLVEVSLPTFWSSKLSHAFASSESLSEERLPRKLTKQELIAKAKALYLSGKSYREISKILGISIGTAYNYVNDYPYGKSNKAPRLPLSMMCPLDIRPHPPVRSSSAARE